MFDLPIDLKNPSENELVGLPGPGRVVVLGAYTRRKVGNAYLCSDATPRQLAFTTMLGDLVATFCGGSIEQLVMALLREEKLCDDDLLERKRLADDAPADDASSDIARSAASGVSKAIPASRPAKRRRR